MPGSPAERAGLVSGDLIVRVDDQPVSAAGSPTRSPGCAASRARRSRSRSGRRIADERTLSLTRDTIRRQALRASMEGDVLVLRLAGFPEAAAASLEQAGDAGHGRNVRPRRWCSTCAATRAACCARAVRVADAFLAGGEIVSLRGSSPLRHRSWQADASELLPGLPMVVLIDARSASAAELVADALQYNRRATVMGQRSFGKGSVQTVLPLGENNGALRLTTAYYHGPSGQTVNRVGVTPDIELVDASRSDAARRPTDAADAPVEPTPPRRAQARVEAARCAAARAVDAALSCAVAYLRAGSVDGIRGRAPGSRALTSGTAVAAERQ
jgi:carboxyl-terminal processing protease